MGKLTAWDSQAYKSLPMCFTICRTRNQGLETAGGVWSRGIIKLYESFLHEGILCLSFEILNLDLKTCIQEDEVWSGLRWDPLLARCPWLWMCCCSVMSFTETSGLKTSWWWNTAITSASLSKAGGICPDKEAIDMWALGVMAAEVVRNPLQYHHRNPGHATGRATGRWEADTVQLLSRSPWEVSLETQNLGGILPQHWLPPW